MSVVAVSRSPQHDFSKRNQASITLVAGYGVQGDCHYGTTVQHRSRLHIEPPPANLRQVHLIHAEILQQHQLQPGNLGENITTRGLDLLSLGEGTELHFVKHEADMHADHAVIAVKGLRNPCPQIDKFRNGLKEKFLERDDERNVVARLAGVMCTVEAGGTVEPGMRIIIDAQNVHRELGCV